MNVSESTIHDALNQALVHLNNKDNRTAYFDLYDESLITHGLPPDIEPNKAGLKTFYVGLWQAFPDLNVIYDDVLINNNKAAIRFTMNGTHKGKFLGIPPSNKLFRVQGMSLFAFREAKCIERWELIDILAMIEQLSPRQQISALMNNIFEFAEVKANKELKEKINRLFHMRHT